MTRVIENNNKKICYKQTNPGRMKAMKTCKTECTKKHIFHKADKNTSVGLRAQSKHSTRKAVRRDTEEPDKSRAWGCRAGNTEITSALAHGLSVHTELRPQTLSGLKDALGEDFSTISDIHMMQQICSSSESQCSIRGWEGEQWVPVHPPQPRWG